MPQIEHFRAIAISTVVLLMTACAPEAVLEPEPHAPGSDVDVEVVGDKIVHGKTVVECFEAKVIAITDGDSIKVLNGDNETIRVRLESIDAPEKKQPFGTVAKNALSGMAFGKTVDVLKTGEDRWGRTLAFVLVDGRNTSVEMVKLGLAWNYVEYSKSDELARLEESARATTIGLWDGSGDAVAPWAWRKKQKAARNSKKTSG